MLDRPLVFLDLETTGATASRDRITEIGLIEVAHGAYVNEWSTLVNPEMPISSFIESLTGISNEMVAQAPTFAEVAQELRARLHGKLLIAHNARFDYGFLKAEFARLETRYSSDLLCTVKLSRKLYPGHARHNLDSLMERHSIVCDARHRALGDARVLWDLVQKWRAELGADALNAGAAAQVKTPALPPGLSAEAFDDLPEAPGVYIFYGENDLPLYIGKGVNLRARVLAHFAGDARAARDQQITAQVKRLAWRQTAGELGALLEETRLARELSPTLSRQAARNRELCAFTWEPGLPPQLISVDDIDFGDTSGVYGMFRSKRAALDSLRKLAQAFDLCHIAGGLEQGAGPCSAYQTGRCRGVCAGRESPAQHDVRLMQALCELKLAAWPFKGRIGVRETGAEHSELHVLDHWCYLGTVRSAQDLDTLCARPAFDLDTYKILNRFLKERHRGVEIVSFAA